MNLKCVDAWVIVFPSIFCRKNISTRQFSTLDATDKIDKIFPLSKISPYTVPENTMPRNQVTLLGHVTRMQSKAKSHDWNALLAEDEDKAANTVDRLLGGIL